MHYPILSTNKSGISQGYWTSCNWSSALVAVAVLDGSWLAIEVIVVPVSLTNIDRTIEIELLLEAFFRFKGCEL